jgi:hypothetical protein
MTYETHATHLQPSVDPLAVVEPVIQTEAPPITSETTTSQLESPIDISMMAPDNLNFPEQSTFSSIASGTQAVEIGLPTSAASAAVPSASITTVPVTDAITGVSPSSLPPLVPMVALAAIGDGHAHPAVQPTTSCKSSVNSVFIY